MPYTEDNGFSGTARYASINSLKGIRHSRRDDLESIGYVLLYFLNGSLPWQGLTAVSYGELYEKICETKISCIEKICEKFPDEFYTYIQYCRNLQYEDQPDYNYLRDLFKNLFIKLGYEYDYKYDWNNYLSNDNINEQHE